MLLPDYHTVKVEQNDRLRRAHDASIARQIAVQRRFSEPRPLFRSRTLRVLFRRVFAPFTSA
jgi:hypothetical protein